MDRPLKTFKVSWVPVPPGSLEMEPREFWRLVSRFKLSPIFEDDEKVFYSPTWSGRGGAFDETPMIYTLKGNGALLINVYEVKRIVVPEDCACIELKQADFWSLMKTRGLREVFKDANGRLFFLDVEDGILFYTTEEAEEG